MKSFLRTVAAGIWRRTNFLRRPWRRKYDALQSYHHSLMVNSLKEFFQGLSTQTQEVNTKTQELSSHVQRLDVQAQWLSTHTQGLEAHIQGLEAHVQGLAVQVNARGDTLTSLTESMAKTLEGLHGRIRNLAAVLDVNLHRLQLEMNHLRNQVEGNLANQLATLNSQTERLATSTDLNLDSVTRELMRLHRQIESLWELPGKNVMIYDQQGTGELVEDGVPPVLESPVVNGCAA